MEKRRRRRKSTTAHFELEIVSKRAISSPYRYGIESTKKRKFLISCRCLMIITGINFKRKRENRFTKGEKMIWFCCCCCYAVIATAKDATAVVNDKISHSVAYQTTSLHYRARCVVGFFLLPFRGHFKVILSENSFNYPIDEIFLLDIRCLCIICFANKLCASTILSPLPWLHCKITNSFHKGTEQRMKAKWKKKKTNLISNFETSIDALYSLFARLFLSFFLTINLISVIDSTVCFYL